MDCKIIIMEEAGSTNSEMSRRLDSLPHGAMLMARRQTAGRGQRGNSWESEPGANVTMSLLLRRLDEIAPARQFVISEAVALAVADTVAAHLPPDVGEQVAVKWPNDIYVGNLKIAGILIECGICGGALTHAIVGIGLNVNQLVFKSDAPNPVSLRAIHPDKPVMDVEAIAREMQSRIVTAFEPGIDAAAIHHRYLKLLWRREGVHLWRRRPDGTVFAASVGDVSSDGFLSLLPEGASSPLPPFAFKEVEAII